ncbi:spidroin-1-like [Symphalangus syndactylus]|uniref:spidroin-1-like n=1 Tax=Symphalangus syndactylus TaxID=9590 RepID=UPI003006876E
MGTAQRAALRGCQCCWGAGIFPVGHADFRARSTTGGGSVGSSHEGGGGRGCRRRYRPSGGEGLQEEVRARGGEGLQEEVRARGGEGLQEEVRAPGGEGLQEEVRAQWRGGAAGGGAGPVEGRGCRRRSGPSGGEGLQEEVRAQWRGGAAGGGAGPAGWRGYRRSRTDKLTGASAEGQLCTHRSFQLESLSRQLVGWSEKIQVLTPGVCLRRSSSANSCSAFETSCVSVAWTSDVGGWGSPWHPPPTIRL